jgi:hypothetical protein
MKKEKVHVHKLAQQHNCSYEWIYQKYSGYIDKKGMIDLNYINNGEKTQKV